MAFNHAFSDGRFMDNRANKKAARNNRRDPEFTFAYAQVSLRPLLTTPPPTIHADVQLVHKDLIALARPKGNRKNVGIKNIFLPCCPAKKNILPTNVLHKKHKIICCTY